MNGWILLDEYWENFRGNKVYLSDAAADEVKRRMPDGVRRRTRIKMVEIIPTPTIKKEIIEAVKDSIYSLLEIKEVSLHDDNRLTGILIDDLIGKVWE